MLHWYARNLCLRYDYTCKFNDNQTLAYYANGIYDYYDVEGIEEFVAFKGAYEIESLFEKCENYDDVVYIPKNYAILKYCYENYDQYNAILMRLLRKSPLSKKRLIFCRKLWKKKLMTL